MREILVSLLLLAGASFALLAAIGLVRFPDLLMRMHPATKAATLGIGFIALAGALHFGSIEITIRLFLVILLIYITAPVAAHMIARAAYFVGVPLWEGTVIDELRGRYDRRQHTLAGDEEAPADDAAHPPPWVSRDS